MTPFQLLSFLACILGSEHSLRVHSLRGDTLLHSWWRLGSRGATEKLGGIIDSTPLSVEGFVMSNIDRSEI